MTDQNYVNKIVDTFILVNDNNDADGTRVIEIGPGTGALTRVLHKKYKNMTAIELDQRSVAFLNQKLPGLKLLHQNVLDSNWPELATERGGKLNVIANLSYYLVSQILFSMADCHNAIDKAVLTMQLEVGKFILLLIMINKYKL